MQLFSAPDGLPLSIGASAPDAVGGETDALALRCIQFGGTMLACGMLSNQPTPVSNGEMFFRGTTIRLVPPVDREFNLADFQAAVQCAEQPGRTGKVIFTG